MRAARFSAAAAAFGGAPGGLSLPELAARRKVAAAEAEVAAAAQELEHALRRTEAPGPAGSAPVSS